jgi:superfamily II DNA or RNA helicase
MKLRQYQEDAVNELRQRIAKGQTRLVLCAPTGAGKTVIFSYIVNSAIQKGKKVMIVTDRVELLTQAGGALNAHGLRPEKIEAGAKPNMNGNCYTAMIETLSRRISNADYLNLIESIDLIIFDECHKQAFNKIFPYIPASSAVIGVTATPHREGSQTAMNEFYQDIVEVASIPSLIGQGFLAKPITYGVKVDLSNVRTRGGDYDLAEMGNEYSRQRVFKGVIENYKKICPNKKAIAFSSNIASSEELTAEFVQAGINARHLDSEMSPSKRLSTLEWYKHTPNAVICNVGILTTGFDDPSIEVVILYRATKSLPLFLQMCGRGSRVTPNKDKFTILDFGNNVSAHGFWEDERAWSLEKKIKRKGVAPVKSCTSCEALVPASARICHYCEFEFPKTEQERQEEAFAELKLLTKAQAMNLARKSDLQQKAMLAKAKVIKPYWVIHNLTSLEEANEFVAMMGWSKGWIYHNRERFPNLR